jgi:osmotically inducible lipoprotein OsmB
LTPYHFQTLWRIDRQRLATRCVDSASLKNGEFLIMAKVLVLTAVLLGVTACGDTWGQRAVTGGGIGAGSGALIGAVTPLGILPGALIGGAVGAGVGAATTPQR